MAFFLLGWEREDWGEVGLALMGTEGDQHVQKLIMVMDAQLCEYATAIEFML